MAANEMMGEAVAAWTPQERESFFAAIERHQRAANRIRWLTLACALALGFVVAMLMAPLMLQQVPGAAGRVRPAFNLVVSNVPGPEQPLYFRGARLDALFPLSIPFHGYGLNITINSYAGTLNFGFTGCREALPHLQRLAVYGGEALDELERVQG